MSPTSPRRASVSSFLILLIWSVIGIANICFGQQPAVGIQAFGSFGGGPFDTINLGNLNIHFAIPVVHKAGRGLPFNYDLTYDSSIWSVGTPGGVSTWQPASTWGWQSQTDAATGYIPAPLTTQGTCTYFNGQKQITETWTKYNYSGYVDQFGTFHHVRYLILIGGAPDCIGDIDSVTETADDGSGYKVTVPDGIVQARDGTVRNVPVATQSGSGVATDANGNQLTTNGSTFTDTLGTTVLSLTATVPTVWFTYTAPGTSGSGSQVSMTLNYTQKTVCTNFGVSTIHEYPPTSVYLVTSISMPDGTHYLFTYEATPAPPTGCTGAVTGRIASVTLPTGGTITYSYQGGSSGYNGIFADGTTSYISRVVNPGSGGTSGTWTYSRSETLPASTTTVMDPLTNETDITFEVDANSTLYYYETGRKIKNGTSTVLETTFTCYNGNNATPSNCATAAVTSAPSGLTERAVFTYLPDATGEESETDIKYNSFGLVTDEYDYDFASTQVGALLRHTNVLYAGLGNNIVDHPLEITVYDGAANVKAETTFSYDEVATTGSGATQLVPITGSRGNLTTLATLATSTTWLYRTFTYYDTGTVITATDVSTSRTTKGPATTFTYATKSSTCDFAFPTSVAEPMSLSRSWTWDCNGGLQTSLTDENTQKTSYIFHDANYWRMTSAQFPDSPSDTATFTYNTTTTPWNIIASRTMDSSRSLTRESVLDGFGRVYKQQLTSDPNATASVDTPYDALGRVASVSNPYYTTTDPTYGITQYAYDALSRTTTVTNPDNSKKQLTYTKRAVQVADEGNNSGGTTHITKVYQVDGLGRMTSVCEASTGVLQGSAGTPVACSQDISDTGFLTSYGYDALGNIISVTQPGVNARSFSYDELSRLTQEINPESGTTTYTYDTGSVGDLYRRTRPKENQTGATTVITTYTFDALHRLATKSYNDAITPATGFYYDQPTPWGIQTVQNTKGRVSQTLSNGGLTGSVFSYDAMGRVVNEWQCTPLNCGNGSFSLSFQYDFLGDTTSLGNPQEGATTTYTYSYDTAGRLTKLQSTLNDSNHPGTLLTVNTYNALGQVQTATLGNGVVRNLNYDNRGRVTSLTDGSIYSFTLGYAPDSNVLTGNDLINGNWTYTSDPMGHIATSSQSGQAFSYNYDPSGNRWKQNVTTGSGPSPQYSFDANNHIVGYSYDAAGNLLNDGFHNYTYDAEGRLMTVDGTAASYTYDAYGQRVRSTVGSTAYDFVYHGGRRMDEVTGSTWMWGHPGGAQGLTYTNGTTYFDHTDWLGTVRGRSNVSGARTETCTSLAYGDNQACAGTDESPQHYASLEGDTESGLQYAWFRQLSTTEGRWATPDPAGVAAVDLTNPQSWNRYAYVVNNPLSYVDPLGLKYVLICTPVADGGQVCDWYDDGSGDGTPPPNQGGRSGGGGGSQNSVTCAGKTVRVGNNFRIQSNSQGVITAVSVVLTGSSSYQAGGSNGYVSLSANTILGVSLGPEGALNIGLNNPLFFKPGGVGAFTGAYITSATYNDGSFSQVSGAVAIEGIPFGSRYTPSGYLVDQFNQNSSLTNVAALLQSLAKLAQSLVGCNQIVGK